MQVSIQIAHYQIAVAIAIQIAQCRSNVEPLQCWNIEQIGIGQIERRLYACADVLEIMQPRCIGFIQVKTLSIGNNHIDQAVAVHIAKCRISACTQIDHAILKKVILNTHKRRH